MAREGRLNIDSLAILGSNAMTPDVHMVVRLRRSSLPSQFKHLSGLNSGGYPASTLKHALSHYGEGGFVRIAEKTSLDDDRDFHLMNILSNNK